MSTSADKLRQLHSFSACDVSDALLKLQKGGSFAHGGFLADMVPFAPKSPLSGSIEDQPKIIAPASTLQLVFKTAGPEEFPAEGDPTAIPKGSHWVDLVDADTVLVIDQPLEMKCAALGGIMAARLKVLGAKGVVVSGRVRDLAELRDSKLPIWARSKSTVGTGAEAKVRARNVPISLRGVDVAPGDIIFCDPLEGVVVIPQDLVDKVLDLMPKIVEADDKVKDAVVAGSMVADAFRKYRG